MDYDVDYLDFSVDLRMHGPSVGATLRL